MSGESHVGAPVEHAVSVLGDTVYLQELRSQMLRFAALQLSDNHLAEDAVQEAMIGALKSAKSFGGRAALKTWVFAILKNKIADVLRQRQRLNETSSLLPQDEDDDSVDLFDAKGFWHPHERPVEWASPETALEDQHFWKVFESCLDHLPGQQARLFMMREFVELDSNEICAAAGVTVTNLNVTLHRARLRLRECLENHWFAPGLRPC